MIEVHGVYQQEKRRHIDTFVSAVALYVAETPEVSIKEYKPALPIIPFSIVAYGFNGFWKQLQITLYMHRYFTQNSCILPVGSQDV